MTQGAPSLSPEELAVMARLAGFSLDEESLAELAPMVSQLLGRLVQLQDLDLQATEPASVAPLPEP